MIVKLWRLLKRIKSVSIFVSVYSIIIVVIAIAIVIAKW